MSKYQNVMDPSWPLGPYRSTVVASKKQCCGTEYRPYGS